MNLMKKKIINNACSIVFHNLHSNNSIKVHGSVSDKKLKKIIIYLKNEYNLLDADIYLNKIINKTLKKNDVCLSFDDGLKSQSEIALPILEKNNLKAFFFVFSEPFESKISNLELYKFFRSTKFKKIDYFYNEFNYYCESYFDMKIIKKEFNNKNYLIKFKFYTKADRFFRYLRDKILSDKNYNLIMRKMMKDKKFNSNLIAKRLYLSIKDLKKIHNNKHIIGLHSHSHPTNINDINYKNQYKEYITNKDIIEKILNNKIHVMAHPCGKFNNQTIKVLKKLNIQAGYGITVNNNSDLYNLSRLDCAYF